MSRYSQGLHLWWARWSRATAFESQGATQSRTRDRQKKVPEFITSSEHWIMPQAPPTNLRLSPPMMAVQAQHTGEMCAKFPTASTLRSDSPYGPH